jgi:hypothetical protein
MRRFSPQDLLRAWEVGESQHPVDRALTLLSTAWPDLTRDELVSLSIGQRDGRLLDLREHTLGPNLDATARCPRCAERLEFVVAVADLRVASEPDDPGQETYKVITDGLELRFRLPNSRDLAASLGCRGPASARKLLAQRCVLGGRRNGEDVDVEELSAEALSGLAHEMADCDPQAEVLLDLHCPACDHGWRAPFDILVFFWSEVAAQANRLLREVDALARAYGWREAEILGMSAQRRQVYLEMASG